MPVQVGVGVGPCLGGGASFSPLSLTGLVAWLKADVGTFQDTSFTTPAVLDADPVGGWQDQSGLGNHVTQATGVKRPALKLAIQNGRPVLRFDGVSDFLLKTPASGFGTTGYTVAVAGARSAALSLAVMCEIRLNQLISRWDPGGTKPGVIINTAGANLFYGSVVSGWHVYDGRSGGGNAFVAVDGAAEVTATDSTNFATLQPNVISVGCHTDGTVPFSGDVGEIVVCTGMLAATPLANLRAYLKSRWGTP